jgi:hypothetical protein
MWNVITPMRSQKDLLMSRQTVKLAELLSGERRYQEAKAAC